jgi:HicB-like protein involved in pilus formation
MDLTPYVETLRQDLLIASEPGGPDAHELADRLTAPLESATRLVLLDALSAAAGEITRDLAPGSVDLRLRGREPSFVVTLPPQESPAQPAYDERLSEPVDDDSAMTRINLRLPQDLKDRVEEAARAAGLSVNAWLVRAATASVSGNPGPPRPPRAAHASDRFTGWVR